MNTSQPIVVNLSSPTANALPSATGNPYPLAIVFATLSLLVALIITPPMFWHFRNRNIGATVLVALAIYANLESFLNAIIWPHDNMVDWFDGIGLCDLEVNLELAAQVAFPASLACILKALARVLDTDNAVLMKTQNQRRRDYAIDILWCVLTPLLQVPFHYVVQSWRYYIFGIAGCVPASDNSWLSILLLITPPVLWILVDVYYSILILVRLLRYRLNFDAILAHSNTSRSRFLRLYLLCFLCVLGLFPLEVYILYVNASTSPGPYSWSEAHNPAVTNSAIFVPSNGQLFYDRYIWLVGGLFIFLFFGFGKDALNMYRSTFLRLGLGRIFPCLARPAQPGVSAARSRNSSQSKVRLLLSKSKDSLRSFWASGTSHPKLSSTSGNEEDISTKRTTSVETTAGKSVIQVVDSEHHRPSPRLLKHFTSIFGTEKAGLPTAQQGDWSPIGNFTARPGFHSSVVADQSVSNSKSPDIADDERVLVLREIWQTSEKDDKLSSKGH